MILSNELRTLLSEAVSPEAKVKSLSGYISSQANESGKLLSAIINVISDEDVTITETDNICVVGKNLFNSRAILESARCVAMGGDDLLVDIDGIPHNTEEILAGLKIQYESNQVLSSALEIISNSTLQAEDLVTKFIEDVGFKVDNSNAEVNYAILASKKILNRKDLNPIQKATSLAEFFGIKATAEETGSNVLPVSDFSDFTGFSPAASWVYKNVNLDIDWDDIPTIAGKVATAVATGAIIVWNVLTGAINSLFKTVKESVIAADDVIANSEYEDYTFDRIGHSFFMTESEVNANASALALKTKILTKETGSILSLDFFGSRFYCQIQDGGLLFNIRWRPLDRLAALSFTSLCMNADSPDMTDETFNLFYHNSITNMFAHDIADDIDDEEMMKSLRESQIATILLMMTTNFSLLNPTMSIRDILSNSTMSSTMLGTAYQLFYIPGSTFTNIDFVWQLARFRGTNLPSTGATYNYSSINSDHLINGIQAIIDIMSNVVVNLDDGEYVPYFWTDHINVGRWRVKTDTENAATFGKFLKVVGITMLVVGTAVVALKVKKYLTNSTLRASVTRDSISRICAEKSAAGTLTQADILSLKKANRKFSMLSKLAGNTSSDVMTGGILSTMTSGDAISSISTRIGNVPS